MKKAYIPLAILNVLLPIILINKAYIVTNISYKNIILLFSITLIIFEVINYIKNKNKKTFLFLIIIFIIATTYTSFYRYSYFTSLFNNLEILVLKINNLIALNYPVDFSLIYPFYTLILPILTFVYLILFKLNLGILVTLINTLILILYDLLKFSSEIKTVLPLYIFLVFINYSLYKLIMKVKEDYMKTLIIYYLIICIIFSGIIYWVMPSKYGKETDVVQYMFNSIINNQEESTSDFATIGINTKGLSLLGKKLQISNDKISLINGDVPSYLRTKVYYNYSFDSWTANVNLPLIKSKQVLNVLDLAPDDEIIKRNIDYNKEKGTKIKTLSIQNLNNNFFDVMISPNYITKVVSSANSYISMYDNENYLVGKLQSNYSINFYDYSDTETFEDYSSSKYKNDINNIQENINKNKLNHNFIRTALYFNSSQRVKELADRITSTSSNNDEKLRLIKNYLLNNYSYNLQPNEKNNNSQDYVDFFLFDEKKGYCKSFASAAVMLCRAVGIPARYVEGFKVRKEIDNKGSYVLRSSDAHAWCEVLTSVDKGTWSILETTPPFDSLNGAISSTENFSQNNNTENMGQQKQSEKLRDNNQVNTPTVTEKKPAAEDKQNNSNKKISNVNLIKNLKKVINYNYAIIVICLIILYILIRFLRRNFIIKNLSTNESLIPLYIFILKRLKTINIIKQPYETDKEFAFRIKDKLNIEPLVEAVYKEAYGNEKTSLDKICIILTVEKIVKNNSNIFKYYIFF
ncbi:MAG: transglutaminase-like enzyme predicted cysteine protease [Clostridium sp.]|nr:transglutaminase-like enzyme predicted cysteine protease [Clostridium sp.]